MHSGDREELRRRFAWLCELSRDVVLLLSSDGRVLECSDSALQAYGFSREELRGKHIGELRDPTTLDAMAQNLVTVWRQGSLRFETRHRRRDGSTFPVEVSSSVHEVDGERHLISLVRDLTERKRVEERFRVAFEASPDAMALTRMTDDQLVAINDGFSRLTGIPEAMALGRSTTQLGIWTDPAERRQLIDLLAAEGKIEELDAHIRGTGGRHRLCSVSARVVRIEGVPHLLALARDVTDERTATAERDRLQARLRESEERLERIVRNMREGVWTLDREGRTTYANEAMAAMFGTTPAEMLGRSHLDFVPAENRAAALAMRSEVMAGKVLRQEFDHRTPEGAVLTFWSTLSPLRDRAGHIVGSLGILLDLTGHRRAEEAHRRSEERLRLILESLNDGVWAVDRDGKVLFANARLGELLGLSHQAMVGRPWQDLVPPEAVPPLARLRVGTGGAGGAEARHRRADGTEVRLLLSAAPVRSPNPEGAAWVGVFTDVTGQRRAEEQFLQAQKLEAVGRLASGIAHDFNNLLVVILGGCEFLLGRPGLDPEAQAEAAEIKAAGERAAGLVRQLMTFSRRGPVAPVVCDLGTVVGRMESLLRRTIGEHVSLEVAPAPEAWGVRLDPGHIDQVLMNLAVNARDAMPRGGRLRIAVRNLEAGDPALPAGVAPGRWVELSVADDGCGMTPEIRGRIFEPFFTTKGPGKGTGLGLSTVFGIVEQVGGRVAVETEPERGSTFRLFFPVTDALPASAPPPVAAPPDLAAVAGATVLVVEDDHRVRRNTVRMLRELGCAVREAASGAEALALAEGGGLDLVLTDVVMPAMLGTDLGAALRSSHPGLPVVYVSGYADSQVHALPEGAITLAKPFTRPELRRLLERVLEGARIRRPGAPTP